jgi:hypothetical protein
MAQEIIYETLNDNGTRQTGAGLDNKNLISINHATNRKSRIITTTY